MRVLVAFDKFKGSLGAAEACDLAAAALHSCQPDWRVDRCPLSDGGEGFADLLTAAVGGRRVPVHVAGPRGNPVVAHLGIATPGQVPVEARKVLQLGQRRSARPIAIVEMAAASGLALLRPDQRDPWRATSFGTGQLIRAAARLHAAMVVLGVGGSATNDLGLGALAALGLTFHGADGGIIRRPSPITWPKITRIGGRLSPPLPPLRIACDVTNPLLGPRGATAVYGPQKGLGPRELPALETAMERMARLLCDFRGRSPTLAKTPGTGAAGGIPFGLMACANARVVPGFSLVSAWLRLNVRIAAADLVLTGEGCFDQTSLAGKGPGAVALAARKAGKAVHVFAGIVRGDLPHGPWQAHAITPPDYSFVRAKREARRLLTRHVREVFSRL